MGHRNKLILTTQNEDNPLESEFFEEKLNLLYSRCSNLKDTAEARLFIKEIFKFGSYSAVSRARTGGDSRLSSSLSKKGLSYGIPKGNVAEGNSSHSPRQIICAKYFSQTEEEFAHEWERSCTAPVLEMAPKPKAEQVQELINKIVPEPNPFDWIKKWLEEPRLRQYIEAELSQLKKN